MSGVKSSRTASIACGVLVLALIVLAPFGTSAATGPSDEEIQTILQNFIERDHWGVGMVVGIIDERGTRVISHGKLDNGDSPKVDGDTLFEIGSITKTFTALLLEDMVRRGEMKLDDPVEKFLPASVKVPAWQARKISLRDLATHTSGLPRDLDTITVERMYDFLSHHRLRRKPGRRMEYSNLGFSLLAHAIELKAGTNYQDLVRERIWVPLKMDSTCFTPSEALRPRCAKSHGQENRTVWDFPDFQGGMAGAGGIRSTANDMLKYLAANLNLGEAPLAPLMEQTHRVQVPDVYPNVDLALPWFDIRMGDTELITHGGSTGGQKAFIGFDKKAKRGVVVLVNRYDPHEEAAQPFGLFLLQPAVGRETRATVPPEMLDSYAGIYEFPKSPELILTIRREGDRLITQLLNAPGREWFPQSTTEFFNSWDAVRLKFSRTATGKTTVAFVAQGAKTRQAWRVSDRLPESLLLPMLQPVNADECIPGKGLELRGSWDVVIRPWFFPFYSLRARLRVGEPVAGVLRAELDVPSNGANNQPASIIYNPPEVVIVVRSGHGMFKGKVNRDCTKITGHWYQGHYKIGTTLRPK